MTGNNCHSGKAVFYAGERSLVCVNGCQDMATIRQIRLNLPPNMGNSYFRFKQFTVQQDRTAMKVCTDSCLFGAFTAAKCTATQVLDIGTGTGLLSLQYIQKHPAAYITAIEIEENAAAQAVENIAASPWKNHISVQHTALQALKPPSTYELILCNPPFFENDLPSTRADRNTAMHSSQLTLSEIFAFARQYLHENGTLALLLPYHRTEEAESTGAGYGFSPSERMLVRQTPRHAFFRSILLMKRQVCCQPDTAISIRDDKNNYTAAFADLLADYYLFL